MELFLIIKTKIDWNLNDEKKSPEKYANIFIDTAHAYDVPILSRYAIPLLEELPQNRPEYEDYLWLPGVLQRFEPLDEKYIKPQALVREFIGGGIYN